MKEISLIRFFLSSVKITSISDNSGKARISYCISSNRYRSYWVNCESAILGDKLNYGITLLFT